MSTACPDPTRTATPDDHVLGDPAAPVTVLEYGDYECPYCAAAAPILRQLVHESDGRIRLAFRNYPLADVHPYALTAALAAEGAAAQGGFWPMHELLFTRQDRLDDVALRGYAEELGLDGSRVVGEAAQPYADKVEADFAAGVAAGVPGTPTLFIDGQLFTGRVELGALRRAIGAGSPDSDPDGRRDPGARRQRRRFLGLRRAQREPLTQHPEQDDPGDRGGQ